MLDEKGKGSCWSGQFLSVTDISPKGGEGR